MDRIIHIDGDALTAVLDQRGWTKGQYGNDRPDAKVCYEGAVRLCQPVPGDAYLVEQVDARRGHGTAWNDDVATTEADVRAWIAGGVDVTDVDLADTFGPQWRAVVALVRTFAAMTPEQAKDLGAAWGAAWGPARAAAGGAARGAAGDAARAAARAAAGGAARGAAGGAARGAAGDAARAAARAAATWDLATPDGRYTYAHRDLLMAPFRAVFGDLSGLLDEVES